jgi:Flp pilus assembly pilin Flp
VKAASAIVGKSSRLGARGVELRQATSWRDGEFKMSKLLKLLDRLRKDERGASMAEYVVLLAVITAGVIAVITAFAGQLTAKFNAVCNSLTGGTGGC